MKTKNINIAIPEELHTFLKVYAAQNGMTMKDVIVEHIRSLNKKKKEKDKTEGKTEK